MLEKAYIAMNRPLIAILVRVQKEKRRVVAKSSTEVDSLGSHE